MEHQQSHHRGAAGLEPVDPLVWVGLDGLILLMLIGAVIAHAAALWAARRRRALPRCRSIFFLLGLICTGVGLLGPLAAAAHSSFTAHMTAHLLLGMVAPLLLVLSAPVSLALRALPVRAARGLTRLLRSRGARILAHPVTSGALNAGGLWLLYTTDLFHVMHISPVAYALIHLHIFCAGCVFTASLVGRDPNPHLASFPVRSAVLILFIAAHSILAKWLYAHPPQGVAPGDARVGAQLMYYGGDLVDITLIILLFAGWYSSARPRVSDRSRATTTMPAERLHRD